MSSSNNHIGWTFQKVIEKFENSEGLRQCDNNRMVQEDIVNYLLVLGSLFTIISNRAELLKNKYSQAVCKAGGHQSYGLPKSVLNAYWEMKGVSKILTSLEVDLGSNLLDSSEVFLSLEDLASWVVTFLDNFSFADEVDYGDFGEGCLPVLERIRRKLIMAIGKADADSLRASLDENWV